MNRNAIGSAVIASFMASGCDSDRTSATLWQPFAQDLSSTVSTYPDRGIVVVFGHEKNKAVRQNQRELEEMSSRLPDVAFVYADTTRSDSDASKVMTEQGLSVPSNLLYDPHGKTWEVLPEVIDSSTRKEVYMRLSFSSPRRDENPEAPDKGRQATASPSPAT